MVFASTNSSSHHKAGIMPIALAQLSSFEWKRKSTSSLKLEPDAPMPCDKGNLLDG